MNNNTVLAIKLKSIAIFRNLLKDNVVSSLLKFLEAEHLSYDEQVDRYGQFLYELYNCTENFSNYIFTIVLNDENVFIRKISNSQIVSDDLYERVKYELAIFEEISQLTHYKLSEEFFTSSDFIPSWETSEIDFEAEYFRRADQIGKFGYGIYAKYHMFNVKDGVICPVKHPDPVTLADLSGYKNERQQVIDNTKALLEGKPAANILLSGDAGTGKSSTIKAVVNEFRNQGLRIIEVRKDQLVDIPSIIDELSVNPLKFILFIDDLSFNQTDDNFSALKAILEGSVSAKSGNVAIYATSNRRHIVKESFKERDSSDDIHRNDTVQELMSLSERFGLAITFVKPTKECYLDIVRNIAEHHNIEYDEERMFMEAERFALIKGGRSARVAKQFVR